MFKKSIDGSVPYYHYRTNWHKIPIISKLMCFLGRHDFECDTVKNIIGNKCDVNMSCFYCCHKKRCLSVDHFRDADRL
jgi:hypothetical protein